MEPAKVSGGRKKPNDRSRTPSSAQSSQPLQPSATIKAETGVRGHDEWIHN
jgi:hypothetical protein